MRALNAISRFGAMLHSIKKMMVDIMHYFLLLFIIVIAFSRAFVTLFRASTNEAAAEAFQDVFSGCRALLEVALNTPNAEKVNEVINRDPKTGEYAEWFTIMDDAITATAWGMLVVYQITTVVILATLLVAMMSRTFQAVDESAREASMFERTQLLLSGNARAELQPPFNLLAIAWNFCQGAALVALRACGFCKKDDKADIGDDVEDEQKVSEPSV